jgi:hypothetical protein
LTKPFRIIGFFEGAFHNEVLESYVHHFLPLTEKIYILTHSFQWEQAILWRKNENIQWIIKQSAESDYAFLSAHRHYLQKCDWLIVTSLPETAGGLQNLHFPCPAWLVIHNIHYFFGNPFHFLCIKKSWMKDMARVIRYFLAAKFYYNQRLLHKFSNIIFPSEVMLQYFSENFSATRFPHPAVIPFIRLVTQNPLPKNKVFTIVVPGSISMEIRDYEVFTQVIPMILEKSNRPVQLYFLGRPKNSDCDHVLHFLEKCRNEKFTFTYSQTFIPQAVFEDKMKSAHLLVAPLQRFTRYDAKCEFFGFSTESGQIADVVKYELPAIVPDFYPLPPALQSRVKKYRTPSDLATCILDQMNSQELHNTTDLSIYSENAVGQMILQQWESSRTKN